MENTFRLIDIFDNYEGICDNCGAEIKAKFLLVSPFFTDKDGNNWYQVLGELENLVTFTGIKFYCKSCNKYITAVRLYKSLNVTQEFERIRG